MGAGEFSCPHFAKQNLFVIMIRSVDQLGGFELWEKKKEVRIL